MPDTRVSELPAKTPEATDEIYLVDRSGASPVSRRATVAGVAALAPAGPQGPAGQDGAQGPQGPAGQDGADGAQGPVGPAGQDATASPLAINESGAALRTLSLGDFPAVVRMTSGSANQVTVPLNADVALPVGSAVAIMSTGGGATTIAAAAGVAINGVANGSAAMDGSWTLASLLYLGGDQWHLSGQVGDVS